MAEGLFAHHVNRKNLNGQFCCDSAGTASYHLGELPDKRMRQTARKYGVELSHRARQFKAADFLEFDYILVMDRSNYNNVMKMKPHNAVAQVLYLRSFDTYVKDELEVPDPYYGEMEDFETVYYLLEDCTRSLLSFLSSEQGS